MNYSFGLLKPDCLKRGIEYEVLGTIEAAELEIVAAKRVMLTKNEVDVIWKLRNEDFYEEFLEFSLSSDCMAYIVKGDNAIDRLSDLIGYYEPTQAAKGTIRYRFGTSAMKNVIHSSATEEAFWKEVSLFFTPSGLKRLLDSKVISNLYPQILQKEEYI